MAFSDESAKWWFSDNINFNVLNPTIFFRVPHYISADKACRLGYEDEVLEHTQKLREHYEHLWQRL